MQIFYGQQPSSISPLAASLPRATGLPGATGLPRATGSPRATGLPRATCSPGATGSPRATGLSRSLRSSRVAASSRVPAFFRRLSSSRAASSGIDDSASFSDTGPKIEKQEPPLLINRLILCFVLLAFLLAAGIPCSIYEVSPWDELLPATFELAFGGVIGLLLGEKAGRGETGKQ